MTKKRPNIMLEMTAVEADILSLCFSSGLAYERKRLKERQQLIGSDLFQRLHLLRMDQ